MNWEIESNDVIACPDEVKIVLRDCGLGCCSVEEEFNLFKETWLLLHIFWLDCCCGCEGLDCGSHNLVFEKRAGSHEASESIELHDSTYVIVMRNLNN